jgi:hypothetical protein
MPVVKCYGCQKEFKKKPSFAAASLRHFCSHRCRKGIPAGHRGGIRLSVKCTNCDKSYKRNRSVPETGKHYCSRECAKTGRAELCSKRKKRTQRNCVYCKASFQCRAASAQKLCSKQCADKALMSRVPVNCSSCGKVTEKKPGQIKWGKLRTKGRFFCDAKCYLLSKRREGNPSCKRDYSRLVDPHRSVRTSVAMKEWREAVFKRDNYACQLCEARSCKGQRVNLNAHHIKKFASNPSLRLHVPNGITLCVRCHNLTKQKEADFEGLFSWILQSGSSSRCCCNSQ